MIDRRSFLMGSASLAASPLVQAATIAREGARSLIVVQLSGGNDGLSTVVPFRNDTYHRLRGDLAFGQEQVLPLNDQLGLHPNLKALRSIWERGHLAVVQGCGYPDPVRSHFKALEVWHTADPRGRAAGDGWIGRLSAASQSEASRPEHVVHVGGEEPYSLHSSTHPACAVQSPTAYRWFGESASVRSVGSACMEAEHEPEARHRGRDRALAQVRKVLVDAEESSLRVRAAAARHETATEFPRTPFGAKAHDLAAILGGGVGARVLSTVMSGFDTHANQRQPHDRLMSELDGGLGALYDDLGRSEAGRQAIVVVFSEFGRRVLPNGSRGTDHGKAGPMFVLGHDVRGGFHGRHPSLESLDQGDLAFTTDFRSVYASLIRSAFELDPKVVLGQTFPELDLVRRS